MQFHHKARQRDSGKVIDMKEQRNEAARQRRREPEREKGRGERRPLRKAREPVEIME